MDVVDCEEGFLRTMENGCTMNVQEDRWIKGHSVQVKHVVRLQEKGITLVKDLSIPEGKTWNAYLSPRNLKPNRHSKI